MNDDRPLDAITIRRAKRDADHPYFMMARSAAQNVELTWEARGVLCYLLSKPDDWETRATDLQQKCGRDKARGILRELEEAGYLEVIRLRQVGGGKFTTNRYVVHEVPLTENPSTVNPSTENPSHTYKRGNKVQNSFSPKGLNARPASNGNGGPNSSVKENEERSDGLKENLAGAAPRRGAAAAEGGRARNVWYDTIQAELGAGGQLNTRIAKMLQAQGTSKRDAPYNLEPAMEDIEELKRFARDYRAEFPGAAMPNDLGKLQSRIMAWRAKALKPGTVNARAVRSTFFRDYEEG